jgi:uncharacterized membrane protein YdbT with pleckstrin-like domain
MASYLDSALVPGEQVLHVGTPSFWGFSLEITTTVILAIATVVLLVSGSYELAALTSGLALLSGVLVAVLHSSIELAVTERRVLAKKGIIRRSTSELYLTRIEGVEIDQGIFGRVLGFGTVRIRGTGDQVAEIPGILKPLDFKKAVFMAGDQAGRSEV